MTNEIPWLSDQYFLMPNANWLMLACFVGAGFLFHGFARPAISRMRKTPWILHRSPPVMKYFLELKIAGPLSWLLTCLLWQALIHLVELPAKLESALQGILSFFTAVLIIRLAYLGVEAFGKTLKDYVAKTSSPLDDQIAPFITKVLKILVVIFGVLILLQNSGVNVVSLLAGLGLGGLALALAAQDTVANLFGSITILFDRPFQIGDAVKVAGTEGTVEEIGFRSTRIRTAYGSLVSIPNSTMAKEQIDNMGARIVRRVRHIVGVTYDTNETQIREFCDHVRYYLQQVPQVKKDDVVVRFNGMGDFSLTILINFNISVLTYDEEMTIQENFLHEVRKMAAAGGVEFAFPTQVHFVKSLDQQQNLSLQAPAPSQPLL